METEKYFHDFEKEVRVAYSVADIARKKGLDPVDKIEIPLAKSLAEKTTGLIATIYPQLTDSGVVQRILDLEELYGKLDSAVAFKIAEEVAKQKFCTFSNQLEAIEAGIRMGFAYITLGVVSSPIEGFTEIKIRKTRDGKDYFEVFFSGPIRSAGTTASCMVLMLIDYLRELFGYAKYDPTEQEVKRYVTENHDYHERVTNLQYMPTDEEIVFLAKNLPIQISGEPTEKIEVSNYKNLERVETDFVRGGMCLIFSEGLAQKAAKGFRLLKGVKKKDFQATGFDFLEKYIELHDKRNYGKNVSTDTRPTYIKDIVAGRPIFGHPSQSGSFRFRYGRSRVSGFSASSVHPATMGISDNFIAIGTQLKIEKPTKGTVTTVCDLLEGPVVKLSNGSVIKPKTLEEAKKIYSDVTEIIYLGDLLMPFSDVANRNAILLKPGYVEEWWQLDLKEKNPEVAASINPFEVNFEKAIEISREYGIPLHPKFILYWTQISLEQFLGLLEWLSYARLAGKIILPYNKTEKEKFELGKRTLELLGIEHEVTLENVVLEKQESNILFLNLGLDLEILNQEGHLLQEFLDKSKFETTKINPEDNSEIKKSVLEIINSNSCVVIKDKAGDFIGARMGRPEKSKLRKLTGSPNTLFPVGKEGGRLRNVYDALKVGTVKGDFPIYYCESCKKETIYPSCEDCGAKCKKMYYCKDCDEKRTSVCEEHKTCRSYAYQNLDVNHYFQKAKEKISIKDEEMPALIKGVRGLSSGGKQTEHLAKGILRAKYGLQVNKDGTIRLDATELPLTAFKPKEIFVSVEKLKELGYTEDVYGKPLENDNQILELMPHDILLPCSPEGTDEKADDVFIRIAQFMDELLVKFYGLEPFYNVKKREDLVGKLGVCMAPHNCAGVVSRIIGFSHAQGLYASPYMHAAIRRDCDGDEVAVMLLLDVLLNFSREFLPSHRGGTQDAPLVLNAKINAGEVDDQILDLEMVSEYPIELYRAAEQKKHSSEVSVMNVKLALKEHRDPFVKIGFTHDTSNFNQGVMCSSYKLFGTMMDKVNHQMMLVEKLRAADTSDTVRLIIERHFIRDLKGNLRKFSTQEFRCVKCNEIVRRPPLTGKCPACKIGKLIFTINEGGIKKYLEPALGLAEKYHLSTYLRQNLEITKRQVESIFGKEPEKQVGLESWCK